MKFGVVVFPGSNCDNDMVYVLESIMQQDVVKLWHKDSSLQSCDLIVLPGGFSFGDYLRSGAIARFSPIMNSVIEHAQKGGLVIGICNGFQILCEAGLLPGALLHNESQRFICKNIYIKPEHTHSVITSTLKIETAIKIPIAHGEGRFFASPEALKELNENQQIMFRYCDANGVVSIDSNPNGSVENIAGICNAGKNVFGMMPHPERAADIELGNVDGYGVFYSMIQHAVLA